jgi:benzoate/toluate 1,2-dioxygenase beta subunit
MATADVGSDVARASVGVSRTDVENFLYAEAVLLDDHEYEAWFELFTQDGIYWIPSGFDDIDPTRQVSVVYDDINLLSERVRRLQSGLAYAQEPRSKTAHGVGNVRITDVEPAGDGKDELLRVEATFVVVEFRRGTQQTHAGRYRYQLVVGQEGCLRIRQKKVELVNNAGHLGNLSLLL